jgi:hypothetical protein
MDWCEDDTELKALAFTEMRGAAGAVAIVEQGGDARYFVITHNERAVDKYQVKLRRQLVALGMEVQWVRPLTRRLQRLLGWGDVLTSASDVQAACKNGNTAELLAIMPSASSLIHNGELEVLPALHEATGNSVLMLPDCAHEFFTENRFQRVKGPCGVDARHNGPFTVCVKCKVARCGKCARNEEHTAEDRLGLLRACHERDDQHEWQDAPKSAECTLCNGHDKVMICKCGAQRCQACLHVHVPNPGVAPVTRMWHHKNETKFFVIDQVKASDDDKLAWIAQEIGQGVGIGTFAATFVALFGDKVCDVPAQKRTCLKLYSKYTSSRFQKESDLIPADQEAFQRVWDPNAPRVCRECAKPVPATMPLSDPYCSDKCKNAGLQLTCWNKVNGVRCTGKVEIRNGCRVCTTCKKGKDTEDMVKTANQKREETSLDRSLKRQADQVRMVSNLWNFGQQPDPDHEPAWAKRRRTAR